MHNQKKTNNYQVYLHFPTILRRHQMKTDQLISDAQWFGATVFHQTKFAATRKYFAICSFTPKDDQC